MYKLSRFFVSDIVAGENILRNGYFPICKEDKQAEHGIIVAANGSCKTTLLSFLFSVFVPDRRRFVQYLQSNGDKTLEQYLVPDRPALVMLELSMDLDATLFESQPQERLVLGQLLHRKKTTPDHIERSYFIGEWELFDSLRVQWEALSNANHPYTAVKEFLSDKVHQTNNQKEWEEKLESLGLDPWLVNRQVDFSRSEGGIKDSFKFKSEADFLSFFLGCVSDLDAAMDIRKNTAQTIAKMKNRPEKKKQLDAVLSLKKNMGEFHDMGREWRRLHKDMENCTLQLGEAAHLLIAARKEADMALEMAEATVKNNRDKQKETRRLWDIAQANQVKVEEVGHSQESHKLKGLIQEADKKLEELQNEGVALKAADYVASQRQFKAEVESKDKILAHRTSDLKPAQLQVALRAAQYHTRLNSQRMESISAVTGMEKEIQVTQEKHNSLKEQLQEQDREISSLNGDIVRLTTQIKGAVMARENLDLTPGEDPEQSLTRLEKEVRDCEKTLAQTPSQLRDLEALQKKSQERSSQLQRSQIQEEETLKQAEKSMADEKAQRTILLGDVHLIRIAGSTTFEPTRADLTTRLGESMARTRTGTHAFQEQLLELKNELKRLENMNSLVVDDQVAKLIAYYISKGLSPAEVKPFLDYLSGLEKTPEEIARVVEGDPGRFSGIMAATDGVIEKVQNMPVPPWLYKPVVISTPRDMDRQGIAFSVISPQDPIVYSKSYLEDQKKHLAEKQEKLEKELSQRLFRIESMEKTQRRLNDYREKYPDMAAVALLSRSVVVEREMLVGIASKIQALETERETHGVRKKELEEILHTETRILARLEQVVKLVKNWLAQYGKRDAWEKDLSQKEIQRVEMNHVAAQIRDKEKQTGDALTLIRSTMAQKRAELKNLEDRADDIPVSEGVVLNEEQLQQAFSMDLTTLRKQHEQAQSNEIRISTELGIDGLRDELQRVREKLQKITNDLDRYRRKNSFDEGMADAWAGKSSRERNERTVKLAVIVADLKEQRAGQRVQLEGRERNLSRCGEKLKTLSRQGIHGDIDLKDLENTDLEGLMRHYGKVAKAQEEKFNELKKHGALQAADLEKSRRWMNELKLSLAMLTGQEPCWDSISPREEWLELVRVERENRINNAVKFKKHMEVIFNSRKKMEALMENSRKHMGHAFDRLQGELRDETLRKQLPAIVDELSRHDAESMGTQSSELMEKCSHIAANIESDLSRSAQFVESLVDQLFQHVRVSYQKLQTASKQLMPDNVFVYGGKPILKAGARLDFTRHTLIYRKTIDNWLDELIQKNYIPEVTARAGDTLGMALLYRLLKVSSAKQEFGIRLLKCDDTGRNYEPVGKDLGSGGEALTTAVLLYSLLTSMRQKRRNKKDDRIPAFLIADNPLGVCNRSDFLDTQLKVARAMGIQCIYFTGINDRESLGLFQHRVAIRHSGKHLQVGDKPFNCLEVIEQNVEDRG